MVAEKQFREDLYFRIKGVDDSHPAAARAARGHPAADPLLHAERRERYSKTIDGIAPRAQQVLMSYAGPATCGS
jgi:transcriptional regulator with PAS, ATPase and Fis domain